MSLDILYEDEYVLVLNKPAGVAVQTAGIGTVDLESEILKYRKRKGEPTEIYVINRLDQPVSGIVLWAKTKEAAAGLTQKLVDHDFVKTYRATVHKPAEFIGKARLEDYIAKDNRLNISRIVSKETLGAKRSTLSYITESESDDRATLLVTLETGRHHQIRCQLSHAGMPIVGDVKYGSTVKQQGISLCACSLSFPHPVTGEVLLFNL